MRNTAKRLHKSVIDDIRIGSIFAVLIKKQKHYGKTDCNI